MTVDEARAILGEDAWAESVENGRRLGPLSERQLDIVAVALDAHPRPVAAPDADRAA